MIKLVQCGVTITAEPRPTLYLEHYNQLTNCDHRHCLRFRIDSQSLYSLGPIQYYQCPRYTATVYTLAQD